jgi:hypothetical protein
MKLVSTSRRCFLRGACGAWLALPLLPSLFASPAGARSAEKPLRFVAIKSYSSQRVVDWYPRFAGRGYRARPFQPGDGKADGSTICPDRLARASGRHADGRAYYASRARLADLARAGQLSNILGPRLNPYLDQLLLLRGLDFMPDTSHNAGGMLGNYAGGTQPQAGIEPWPTLDQTLAFSPRFYRQAPLGPRSLHLSLGQTNTFSFTHNGVADGNVSQVLAHTSPRSAFREVFGEATPEARARQKTLVDLVLDDYRSTVNDPRLSRADRTSLERHVALLHDLQASLSRPLRASCRAPEAPKPEAFKPEEGSLEAADIRERVRRFIELAVCALRCDLTRVVTFDVWQAVARDAGGEGYAHSSAKGPRDWHEHVHQWGVPRSDAIVRAINQWIAEDVFATLLQALAESEEEGETLLDRSLVFWGNELGMNHHNYSVPALCAGSAGGRLRTGQYVDYIDWDRPLRGTQENAPIIEGVPHNRWLVTLLSAFGLQPRDYERPGQPGYGCYKTVGKSPADYPIDYDASAYGAPLPGLLKT